VYISTRELISNLVNKKGTTGKEAFEKMNKGDLVDDRIINALVKERIN
jgi:adenylate kinase